MTTASLLTSRTISSTGCISTWIATCLLSFLWTTQKHNPHISLSIMLVPGRYIDHQNRLCPVLLYKNFDAHKCLSHYLFHPWTSTMVIFHQSKQYVRSCSLLGVNLSWSPPHVSYAVRLKQYVRWNRRQKTVGLNFSASAHGWGYLFCFYLLME